MAKELKHLLVITPGFPDGGADTACLPAVQQFLSCYRRIYDRCAITVVALQYPFKKSAYTWHDISVHALGGQNKSGLAKLLLCLKAVSVCSRIYKHNPYDAILSFCLCETAWVGKRVASKYELPFAIWMFGQDAKPGNKYFKLVQPGTEQLLPISAWQSEVLEKAYQFKADNIVNNGVNTLSFPVLNSAAQRDIDLCAVGSLISLKQYHLFIDVVKHVKENGYPNVKAVLVGDGELMAALKDKCAAAGLNNNIHFTGKLSHEQTLMWMNRSRIFIHPSMYEGHSTVMLEAMYSGCDVVSFLPAGDKELKEGHICSSVEQLYATCLSLMASKQSYYRALYYDMTDSARKIYSILTRT
jgi:Glycosyltransferase